MSFLVDANVLSETTRQHPDSKVVEWLRRDETKVVVNPIILGELAYGILSLAAGRRRARLADWFAAVVGQLRVLDLDQQTVTVWASLLADLKKKGRTMPVKDSLIAASALQHRLTVVTRNVIDYRYTGATLLDPFRERG